MSRRIRTKMRRMPHQMGLNHHKEYSQTTTCFPHSYSILGTPISMPSKVMPLMQDSKLNIVSNEANLHEEVKNLLLEKASLSTIQQANISVSGNITKVNNKFITTLIFILSMFCCCVYKMLSLPVIRSKFYTKYSLNHSTYMNIAAIIKQLKQCSHFIINIQDNDLNQEKISILEDALTSEQQLKKTIIIRNYCYLMKKKQSSQFSQWFPELFRQQNVKFAFVWQKLIIKSGMVEAKTSDEEESLINTVLEC